MAAHINHTSLLLLGLIFVSQYLVLLAQPLNLSSGLEGQATPYTNEANGTTNVDQTENKENDVTVLKTRDFGMFSNSPITFSGRVDISNSFGGLTIRANAPDTKQGISIGDNKVSVGGKVVCDDINALLDKATYQKSSDGTLWYTNIKVGESMTQAEIDAFEKDWAQYGKEQEEKWRRRDAGRGIARRGGRGARTAPRRAKPVTGAPRGPRPVVKVVNKNGVFTGNGMHGFID